MPTAIIKLINDGVAVNGIPFSAIYGEYTLESNVYIVRDYRIHVTNVASVYVGILPTDHRIQNLLAIT